MIPLVSIIVPVYNVQPYLRQCMEGLIGQTLRDIEIICVDDGSTDGSSDILAEYAAKDERIRVITQENAGLSAARNTGLDAATAPLIMFCDSDDWYAPMMCEKMYAAMQNGADMAVCGVQETTQEGNLCRTSDYFSLPGEGEITPNDDLFLRTNVVAWNKIHRREIIVGKHLHFPVGLHFEDEYFYAVYTAYIKTMVFVPNKFYFYRRRAASIIGQARKNALNYAVQRVQIANRIWQYHEECQMVGRRLNYLIALWLRLCAESLSNIRRSRQTQTIEDLIVPFARKCIIPYVAHIPRLQKKRLELLKHRWVGTRRCLGGMFTLRTREKLDPDSCTIFHRYRLFGISCWKREEQYANRADKKKLLFCI